MSSHRLATTIVLREHQVVALLPQPSWIGKYSGGAWFKRAHSITKLCVYINTCIAQFTWLVAA